MLSDARWQRLEDFLLSDRGLAPSTTSDVLRKLRHVEHAGVRIERPTRLAWRRFIAAKKQSGCGACGQRHYIVAIRHALAWLGRSWPELELPTESHPPRPLLPDDVLVQLLEYDHGRNLLEAATVRCIFRAIFYWTLRPPSEVFSLGVEDLDVAHGRLRVWMDKEDLAYETIGLRSWEVDVGREYLQSVRPRVLDATRPYRRGRRTSTAFFLDPWTGEPFASVEALGMFLRRHAKRVYASAKPYDLRIGGASWLYSQTHDIDFVQRRLRHKTRRSTEWYLRAFLELQQDRAHEIQPFDGNMMSPVVGRAVA